MFCECGTICQTPVSDLGLSSADHYLRHASGISPLPEIVPHRLRNASRPLMLHIRNAGNPAFSLGAIWMTQDALGCVLEEPASRARTIRPKPAIISKSPKAVRAHVLE
jgi:hypothetical protein